MGVLLALGAAIAYGLSDFVGGLVSRRSSPWSVAFVAGAAAAVGAVVLATLSPGSARPGDLAWGAAAGVGSGLGGAFLYRGLAAGRMGVVGPVSAVGAALLPVAVAVLTGERPSTTVWVGIAAAVPGIWLVSREPGPTRRLAAGLTDGVLAGLGFGLLFAALGQVPERAGLAPLAAAQVVALVTVAVTATLLGAPWWPRRRIDAVAIAAGLLATAAAWLFLLATRTGLLTVAAVLTSLYPAVTIVLAAAVLRERVHAAQGAGLVLCGVCVALVAAG